MARFKVGDHVRVTSFPNARYNGLAGVVIQVVHRNVRIRYDPPYYDDIGYAEGSYSVEHLSLWTGDDEIEVATWRWLDWFNGLTN